MKKFLACLLLLACTAAHGIDAAPPGDDLEARVIAALRQTHAADNPRLDESGQYIQLGKIAISLQNIRKEIDVRGLKGQAAVDFAMKAVALQLEVMASGKYEVKTWEEAAPLVLPNIAPSEYRQSSYCFGLSAYAARCYVIDLPTAKAYVTARHLAAWGVDRSRLEAAAYANLDKIANIGKLKVGVEEGGKTLYVISELRDSYAATRILLPRVQSFLRSALGGPAFVAIPNRDFFIAWPPGRDTHPAMVEQVRHDVRRQSYPLTHELFVLDADGLRLATPEETASGTIRGTAQPPVPASAASSPSGH